jgi:hypothetical protein
LFRAKIAWEGIVETFDRQGHLQSKRCYAWSFTENGEPKYTTVLELFLSIRRKTLSKWQLHLTRIV